MNAWKVILATLVIYSAGLITGGLLVRQVNRPTALPPRPPVEQGPVPWMLQQRFLERMKFELNLTPDQTVRIERIFIESRERTRIITELIRPEMRAEVRALHDKVLAELNPDQKRRFQELMKGPPPRGNPPFGPRRNDMRQDRRSPPPTPQEHSAPPQ